MFFDVFSFFIMFCSGVPSAALKRFRTVSIWRAGHFTCWWWLMATMSSMLTRQVILGDVMVMLGNGMEMVCIWYVIEFSHILWQSQV